MIQNPFTRSGLRRLHGINKVRFQSAVGIGVGGDTFVCCGLEFIADVTIYYNIRIVCVQSQVDLCRSFRWNEIASLWR